MLDWQGEHSVDDVGSCPSGHVAAEHVLDPSRLNFPSVQGVQSSADKESLNVLTWQGTHVFSDVAPKVELAFPASHGRQVSADVAEREELRVFADVRSVLLPSSLLHLSSRLLHHAHLCFPAPHRLQVPGPSTSLYCPAGQGSQSVSEMDPLPSPHDEHGIENEALLIPLASATAEPALSLTSHEISLL